jgi:two-component system, OmpR family, response regulator
MQPPPRSVLVVDDDRHLCDILTELLSEAGYTVGCAHDGEEAWQHIQRRPPDIIVSDITMPGLDGIGLASRLASCGYATPIILMSAGHRDWTGVSATFIRKPFDLDHLLAALANILSRPTTQRTNITA